MSELATVHPKKNRMLSKIYAKFMYFFLLVQALPALDHVDLNSDGSFQTGCDHKIISITSEFPLGQLDRGKQNKIGKKQCLPSLWRSSCYKTNTYTNNYCIIKYIMIGPTSVFKKNYNRHTLGLLLLCLKVALGPGGKKRSSCREKFQY